jgi:hypothetical protein
VDGQKLELELGDATAVIVADRIALAGSMQLARRPRHWVKNEVGCATRGRQKAAVEFVLIPFTTCPIS